MTGMAARTNKVTYMMSVSKHEGNYSVFTLWEITNNLGERTWNMPISNLNLQTLVKHINRGKTIMFESMGYLSNINTIHTLKFEPFKDYVVMTFWLKGDINRVRRVLTYDEICDIFGG